MSDPEAPDTARTAPAWQAWTIRGVAALAVATSLVVAALAWDAVVHGHPAYAILLAVTVVVGGLTLVRWRRSRRAGGVGLLLVRATGVVAALAWVALIAWLKPFVATEPALAWMEAASEGQLIDYGTVVSETATTITLEAVGRECDTAVLFYPGARVDPRAYVPHLSLLADECATVVIVKEPLGIAFLSMGALESAQARFPGHDWVVAGHSLGGTVAALDAERADTAGLLLWASYPAGDMNSYEGRVTSVSGSNDGLATPADIEASRADLPDDASFTEIEGAVHAQFGYYGAQPGDGVPTIGDDKARDAIVAASLLSVHLPRR
ncbi:alpha/beta hydrolase [Demequina rhizosphaerae]|uniref:alpha/beta hydrolase n=1 Tax=Demequina rhizosphaerae TaxID=1638985 RepID=UPI0007816003|nr:alpha/beta hydrolase [Demequina rhizosphaerae]